MSKLDRTRRRSPADLRTMLEARIRRLNSDSYDWETMFQAMEEARDLIDTWLVQEMGRRTS